MNELTFRVEGLPAPQGSKRHVGGGRLIESSKKVGPWRNDVAAAAAAAIALEHAWAAIDGPAEVIALFRFDRPKGHYGTGRNAAVLKASAPALPTSHGLGDLDKLVRSTFDALTAAGVFVDDSLVVDLHTRKRYRRPGQSAGVTLRIRPIPTENESEAA